MDKIVDFINANRDRYIDELKQYLAIPSISALPEHAGDVRALRRVDGRRDAPHRPAERAARSRRPAIRSSTATGWARRARRRSCSTATTTCSRSTRSSCGTSPPFEATVRDGEIYARGAADDKGQVFMHFKAIEAHLKQHGRLPVQHQGPASKARRKSAAPTSTTSSARTRTSSAADVVVISDSPMFDRGVPSICYGLRGLAYFQIDLRGTDDATCTRARSAARWPTRPCVLAQILAQMKDKGGRIKIPGFYDDVRRAAAGGARGVASGCRSTRRSTARSSARRSCSARPATRRSSACGRGRPSRSTACCPASPARAPRPCIPAVAMAKVSMRLVPEPGSGEDRRAVRGVREEGRAEDRGAEGDAHARRQAVDDRASTTRSCRRPAAPSSRASARRPVFTREGGSIPVVSTFQEELGLPCGALRRRPARRERARARTRSSTSATSTTASSRRRISTRRSAAQLTRRLAWTQSRPRRPSSAARRGGAAS